MFTLYLSLLMKKTSCQTSLFVYVIKFTSIQTKIYLEEFKVIKICLHYIHMCNINNTIFYIIHVFHFYNKVSGVL